MCENKPQYGLIVIWMLLGLFLWLHFAWPLETAWGLAVLMAVAAGLTRLLASARPAWNVQLVCHSVASLFLLALAYLLDQYLGLSPGLPNAGFKLWCVFNLLAVIATLRSSRRAFLYAHGLCLATILALIGLGFLEAQFPKPEWKAGSSTYQEGMRARQPWAYAGALVVLLGSAGVSWGLLRYARFEITSKTAPKIESRPKARCRSQNRVSTGGSSPAVSAAVYGHN